MRQARPKTVLLSYPLAGDRRSFEPCGLAYVSTLTPIEVIVRDPCKMYIVRQTKVHRTATSTLMPCTGIREIGRKLNALRHELLL